MKTSFDDPSKKDIVDQLRENIYKYPTIDLNGKIHTIARPDLLERAAREIERLRYIVGLCKN